MRNITVKEGEPIYLDVKVSGEPAPEIAWFVNGKPLQSTNHKRVENIPYNTKFFNDNPERKDTGTYKIVAQNKFGQDTAEIEINVICKFFILQLFDFYKTFITFEIQLENQYSE